jgi:hypothetical protein
VGHPRSGCPFSNEDEDQDQDENEDEGMSTEGGQDTESASEAGDTTEDDKGMLTKMGSMSIHSPTIPQAPGPAGLASPDPTKTRTPVRKTARRTPAKTQAQTPIFASAATTAITAGTARTPGRTPKKVLKVPVENSLSIDGEFNADGERREKRERRKSGTSPIKKLGRYSLSAHASSSALHRLGRGEESDGERENVPPLPPLPSVASLSSLASEEGDLLDGLSFSSKLPAKIVKPQEIVFPLRAFREEGEEERKVKRLAKEKGRKVLMPGTFSPSLVSLSSQEPTQSQPQPQEQDQDVKMEDPEDVDMGIPAKTWGQALSDEGMVEAELGVLSVESSIASLLSDPSTAISSEDDRALEELFGRDVPAAAYPVRREDVQRVVRKAVSAGLFACEVVSGAAHETSSPKEAGALVVIGKDGSQVGALAKRLEVNLAGNGGGGGGSGGLNGVQVVGGAVVGAAATFAGLAFC